MNHIKANIAAIPQLRWRVLSTPGYRGSRELRLPNVEAVYVMDDQGFSVEVWYLDEELDATVGFFPKSGAVDWR